MRSLFIAAAFLSPGLALAEEAPAFPECLVMPPGAELVSAEMGNDTTAYQMLFVLKVPDRMAAVEAVRAELEARNESVPQNIMAMEGQVIHTCDAETVGVFETEYEAGPGEATYLIGLAGG